MIRSLVRAGAMTLAKAALLAGLLSAPAAAGELKVLSGGAAKAGLTEALASFEKAAAAKSQAEYAPMGRLTKALTEGASPDIVVVTSDILAETLANGWIVAGTSVPVGSVGVGVAVHANAAAPDISTPEAFKATLLAARSIVMIDPATGTSGKHLAKVFADLGIADALKPKTTLLGGGYVVEKVGTGEIELGLHQITEILPVKGIKLVGPLPAPLQKITTYVASVGAKAREPELARRFLAHLATADVRKALAAKGFQAAQ